METKQGAERFTGGHVQRTVSLTELPEPQDLSQACRGEVMEVGGAPGSKTGGLPVCVDASLPVILDREKNISFLLKELDSLRAANSKLQLQLVQKQKELEEQKLGERESQLGERGWETPGAVLEQLYSAQRDRDQALMARLRLANEERDEALLRSKRLLLAAAEIEDIMPESNDMEVDELLSCLTAADCSADSILQGGAVLLTLLQKTQQRRAEITAQEMKALIEERDLSVAKLKHLEQLSRESATHTACKEEVETLQKERDEALQRSHRLEAELQQLQANHSLHGSAPPELHGSSPPPLPPTQQRPLLELHRVCRELEASKEAEREACCRAHRLERLVEVLRKKVGTGSVRAVI